MPNDVTTSRFDEPPAAIDVIGAISSGARRLKQSTPSHGSTYTDEAGGGEGREYHDARIPGYHGAI